MRITAVANHVSLYPDPIRFSQGDPLQIGNRVSEYPGWIWVTTASGKKGWAPESYIRKSSDSAGFASHDYTAKELNTLEGDRLVKHGELNDWLWVENEYGESGWVPKTTTNAE